MISRTFAVWILILTLSGDCLTGASAAHAQDNGLRDLLERVLPGERPQQPVRPPNADGGASAPLPEVQRRIPFSQGEIQLSFAPLVAQISPSVVNVYAARRIERRSPFAGDPFFDQFFGDEFRGPPRVQSSLGSGVIVSRDGLVVTNNHVIDGADEVRIALADGREHDSRVVLRDERSDLAVLQINDGGEFPALAFGNSDALETGDLVLAIGNPFGVGQTITSGIVSAVARNRVGVSDFGFFIQTDAAINPGNSGGALVNMSGELVGINTAIFTRSGGSNGIGFAIPADMVRAVVNQAAQGSSDFERPYIGAGFVDVTSSIAEALGLDRPYGALVNEVYAESPAARAGLREGDLVTHVDGRLIEHPEALGYRLVTAGAGQTVTLTVLARGRSRDIPVTLGDPETRPQAARWTVTGRNPFAGSVMADLTPQIAARLRLPRTVEGVVIIDIERGSPAVRTGFQIGDVITNINGAAIQELEDARVAIARGERSWRLVVNRRGRTIRQFLRY